MSRTMLLKLVVAGALAVALGLFAKPGAAADPSQLRIAAVLSAGKESPWEISFIDSINRVIAATPHGLTITVDYSENVYDTAEQVFRAYAETGNYDIVFGDSGYADAIDNVRGDYPDTMFVMTGSGNRSLGGNAFWIFIHTHEQAYAMGAMAGKLTKSNTIGVVSSFPAEDTNDQINSFVAGAKEANPAAKVKITFIQSWYDPPKSNEATIAQVAAGADQIFQMSGAFEACQQRKVVCYGNYIDMSSLAPDAIVASATANWDPHINWIIDNWWQVKTQGGKFDAPADSKWFSWKDGGGEVIYNPALIGTIPADVKQSIDALSDAIISGEKQVALDMSEPKSD